MKLESVVVLRNVKVGIRVAHSCLVKLNLKCGSLLTVLARELSSDRSEYTRDVGEKR